MTNYLIEEDVKEFIRRLPVITLDPPSVHLQMLNIRSRKAREIMGFKIHDLVVERRVIRPIPEWRDKYFNSTYNLSVLQHEGRYECKGILAPAEAMGIFATISPRSVEKANIALMKETIEHAFQKGEDPKRELSKVPSKFFGYLHAHKERSRNFVTLDIDNDSQTMLFEILDKVSILPIWMATETSRGYHVILELTKSDDARTFYGKNGLMQQLGLAYAKQGLEIQRDSQEPLSGTAYYRKKGSINYVRIIR